MPCIITSSEQAPLPCENSSAKPTQEPVSYVNPNTEHATKTNTKRLLRSKPRQIRRNNTSKLKPFRVTKALFYHTHTHTEQSRGGHNAFSMSAMFLPLTSCAAMSQKHRSSSKISHLHQDLHFNANLLQTCFENLRFQNCQAKHAKCSFLAPN